MQGNRMVVGREGYTVMRDGAAMSFINPKDPTHMPFWYVRQAARLIDHYILNEPDLRVLHIGGGGMALPRYVKHRKPDATQEIVEVDHDVVNLIGQYAPWDGSVTIANGADYLNAEDDETWDVVIMDAFNGLNVPKDLMTVPTFMNVRRVLRPGGAMFGNVIKNWHQYVVHVQRAFSNVTVEHEPGTGESRNTAVIARRD